MAKYIDRAQAVAKLTMLGCQMPDSKLRTVARCVSAVELLPIADVVEIRHGHWIGLEYDGYADGLPVYDLWKCSECGEEVRGEDVPDTHPWCHSCGAKMDGDSR